MVNPSIKLKILILPLAIAISVGLLILYIKPTYTEMNEVKASLTTKQNQLAQIKEQNQRIQQMKASWENLGEEKNIVAIALPESMSVDYYVSELNSKATRSGVLMTDIKGAQMQNTLANSYSYICGSINTNAAPGTASPASADSMTTSGSSMSGTIDQTAAAEAVVAPSCTKNMNLNFSSKGTWEQMIDFLKYLEDMNRISNMQSISIATESQGQDQSVSDILSFNISAQSFYKEKDPVAIAGMANELASQDGLNQGALEKLKSVVYSLYSPPQVSPAGQRNLFK